MVWHLSDGAALQRCELKSQESVTDVLTLQRRPITSFSVVLRLKWSWCCPVYTRSLKPHSSCVITEGQGWTCYLYSALRSMHFLFPLLSLQDATRDSVTHSQQKHWAELSKTCDSNATSLPVRSITEEPFKTRCYFDCDFVINHFDNTAHLNASSIGHMNLKYYCFFNVCTWE